MNDARRNGSRLVVYLLAGVMLAVLGGAAERYLFGSSLAAHDALDGHAVCMERHRNSEATDERIEARQRRIEDKLDAINDKLDAWMLGRSP